MSALSPIGKITGRDVCAALSPTAAELFALRAWARLKLAHEGAMEFQSAVDGAWQFAVNLGLVDDLGIDEVQRLLAQIVNEVAQ